MKQYDIYNRSIAFDGYFCFLFLAFFFLNNPIYSQDQPFLSEYWTNAGGETAMFYRSTTTTDNQGNVYVAGSTINLDGNHDILLQKFDEKGILLWEQTYNGAANMDDAASDVFVDNFYNVYITGTAVDNVNDDQDLIVLKYNVNGVLQDEYYYNNSLGTPIPKDAGTSIIIIGSKVYVTGMSFGQNSLADFVTISLYTDGLNEIWVSRYNYVNLHDIPTKINFKENSVYVSGASQSDPTKWELVTVSYNSSNGTQNAVNRTTGNATNGVDEIYDATIDNQGNIYLVGAVKNQNTDYDLAIYKLDEDLNLIWEKFYDSEGLDDRGKGIKVDDNQNVYIAGYVTTTNQGKNYILRKYKNDGTLLWSKQYNGTDNENDEAVQLILGYNQVFVTGKSKSEDFYSIQTLLYNEDGEFITQAEYEMKDHHIEPVYMSSDNQGGVIILGQFESDNNFKTLTIKYNFLEKPIDILLEEGELSYNANELIIRFNKDVMNKIHHLALCHLLCLIIMELPLQE
ncbi:MAG: hypothetical protein H3C31_02100 [Brumimicrobium sp.]|nr:hypothetical protein [Brumimicrobium sp.]